MPLLDGAIRHRDITFTQLPQIFRPLYETGTNLLQPL
jgi:hypothetical protein